MYFKKLTPFTDDKQEFSCQSLGENCKGYSEIIYSNPPRSGGNPSAAQTISALTGSLFHCCKALTGANPVKILPLWTYYHPWQVQREWYKGSEPPNLLAYASHHSPWTSQKGYFLS